MKRIQDMTIGERAALTDEDVERLGRIEAMETGKSFALEGDFDDEAEGPALPAYPEEPRPVRTVFALKKHKLEAPSIFFNRFADCEAAYLAAMDTPPEAMPVDGEKSYRHYYVQGDGVLGRVSMETVDLYDADEVRVYRDTCREVKRARELADAEAYRRRVAYSNATTILADLFALRHEARRIVDEYKHIRETFASYVKATGGDRQAAIENLRAVFTDKKIEAAIAHFASTPDTFGQLEFDFGGTA